MEKAFNTKKYGEVTVRNAMLDTDGTNLKDGIEITQFQRDFDLIEICEHFDVEEMTDEQVEKLIDQRL